MSDLAIKSKRILNGQEFFDGYLLIDNGKIAGFSKEIPTGIPVDDVADAVVMPGIVDCHVHINEPGRTDWEGFETATQAAAAGGITTLIDMPLNCSPVTTSRKALETKLNAVKGKLWVDCGFWGGVIPDNKDNLDELLKAGALGAKAFLIDSGIDEFPFSTEADLREQLPVLKKHGRPLLVHAELEKYPGQTAGYNNSRSYQAFLDSRPKEIEDEAVKLMINLCREYDTPVHIVHLSSAGVLDEIRKAKAEGIKFSVETCPHYLTFAAEKISDGDTSFKCCPPIREQANNELLWEALKDGTIDFIVSDHSPCTANLKLMEEGDIEKAWGGIAGLQFSFSAIWTEAQKRGFSIQDISRLMSENTAAFTGLGNRKGKLEQGYDADIVIWHPEKSFKIKEENIRHKNKVTPYLNCELSGVVEKTYVRGRKVYEKDNFGPAPTGEFLLF